MNSQINLGVAKFRVNMVLHRVAQNRSFYADSSSPDSVVISGISCRLPSCASFTEFGRKLRDGTDMVTDQTRFNSVRVPKRLGLLSDLSKFDAGFFKVSPKFAEASDPQLRMLLEVVFETIVDAGLNPEELSGKKVGVYVAASGGDTADYNCLTHTESQLEGYKLLGAAGFMMANHISYCFNFKGTSLLLSSGCCSSLVALETAVSSIREGRIDSAIVGATCVYLNALSSVEFVSLGAISPDGICRAFDNLANGFVRSEAIISVLLQRQVDAKRCRATVRAVCTNHDGYKPEGIPYPSSLAQIRLLEEIYGNQIDPSSVTYVEAHGTGTPSGDPEELEAISEIFSRRQSQNQSRTSPLLIGSVKTNLGHTEAAAGLCGIAKVLTMFQSGVIPPTLNYNSPNLKCHELVHGSLQVVSEPTPFTGGLVGVSGLSLGGVNGHAVLEQCLPSPEASTSPEIGSQMIMLLSGRSKSYMQSAIESNMEHLQNAEFRRLVYSVFGTKIPGHNYRGYGILKVSQRQQQQPPSTAHITESPSKRPPVWFIFTGLKSEIRGIEEGLGQNFSPFASSLSTSYKVLKEQVGLDLKPYLASRVPPPDEETRVDFVALTAVQIAFVDTLKAIGVEPDGMIGYSAGEFACAYLEGSLTQAEALLQSYYHGKSCTETNAFDGDTASIGISWGDGGKQCPPEVYSVCRNSKPMKESVEQEQKPENVESASRYCVNNLRNVVQLYDALCHMPTGATVLEIGLSVSLKSVKGRSLETNSFLPLSDEVESDPVASFFHSIGQLYTLGVEMDVSRLLRFDERAPVSTKCPDLGQLVTWDRTHSWSTYVIPYPKNLCSTIRVDVRDPQWSFIRGHRIGNSILFPATGYLCLAWTVFADRHGQDISSFPIEFRHVNFRRTTVISDASPVDFQFSILSESGQFEIRESDELVVEGKIKTVKGLKAGEVSRSDLSDLSVCSILSRNEFYKEARMRGYMFSGTFRTIAQVNYEGNWADVEWNENWVTFLDGMLQSQLLHVPVRSILIPVHIPVVALDPPSFLQHLRSNECQGKRFVRVFTNTDTSVTYTPGIVIGFPEKKSIKLYPKPQAPVLREEIFVPFCSCLHTPSPSPWTKILELVAENHCGSCINVLVMTEDLNDSKWDEIKTYFLNHSHLNANIVKSEPDNVKLITTCPEDGNVSVTKEWNLVITDDERSLQLATELSDSFVISLNRLGRPIKFSDTASSFTVTAVKASSLDALTLFKKKWDNTGSRTSIEISSQNFNWLVRIQNALKESFARIYLWTRDPGSGIVGLVRCLRKESGGDTFRCLVFPQHDRADPDFQNPNLELLELMKKDLAICVNKNNTWGSYAHVRLSESPSAKNRIRNVCLCNASRDGLPGTRWVEIPVTPSDKQLQYLVSYASINFRDVMVATGALQVFDNPLGRMGIEFSGTDSQGNRAMGMTYFGSLSTFVTPLPEFTWKVPNTWTLEDAATVPVAYTTVYFALLEKGRMQPKQSVLIHSGAGGTGLAAIQLAISLSCDVFTTVGTQEKLERLLKVFPQLRRERIGSSRDEAFVEMVMTGTKGKGVDIVLNSLTGDLVDASLQCVARGGKFLDISGAHMMNDTVKLNMRPFLKNVEYHGVFLNQLEIIELKRIVRMVQKGIEAGTVVPLERSVFPREDVRKAMSLLMKGRNVGKVLVRMQNSSGEGNSIEAEPRIYLDPGRMYVVVGGLGGIGFELVNWLVERGAQNVTIVSQSGQVNSYHAFNMQRWKSHYDAKVTVANSSLENGITCQDLIVQLESSHGIAGIFVCALVLKDGSILDLTVNDFVNVQIPKATITRNLDEISRKICKHLNYFVVFSSVVGSFGNELQSNYGWANEQADRVCERRAKMGYHALSLQLGLVSDVGYVADKLFPEKEIAIDYNQYYKPQTIVSVLETLERLLILGKSICSSCIPRVASAEEVEGKDNLLRRVLEIIGADVTTCDLDPSTKLKDLGVDSLSAALIRQILRRDYNLVLSVRSIADVSLSDLTELEESR